MKSISNFKSVESLTSKRVIVFASDNSNQAELSWDDLSKILSVSFSGNMKGKLMQDVFRPLVYNNTGSTLAKGTSVYTTGYDPSTKSITVAPFLANNDVDRELFLGVCAQNIENGETGFVQFSGILEGINTSGFEVGGDVFASETVAGTFTDEAPGKEAQIIKIGVVAVSDAVDGKINLNIVQYKALHDFVGFDDLTEYLNNLSEYTTVKKLGGSTPLTEEEVF